MRQILNWQTFRCTLPGLRMSAHLQQAEVLVSYPTAGNFYHLTSKYIKTPDALKMWLSPTYGCASVCWSKINADKGHISVYIGNGDVGQHSQCPPATKMTERQTATKHRVTEGLPQHTIVSQCKPISVLNLAGLSKIPNYSPFQPVAQQEAVS